MHMKKAIKINYRNIELIAVGYLVLPIIVFLVTWLRIYFALPASVILLYGSWKFARQVQSDQGELEISLGLLAVIVLFVLLWVSSTGIGNFFVSGFDQPWRNAVFRDLIDYSWPVVYENGNSLVYYLFYWFVPAMVGKAFGWIAGNVALVCWTAFGLLIVFALISKVVNLKEKAGFLCALVIFWGWGGLDVVGAIIVQILNINAYYFGLWDCNVWTDYFLNGYAFNYAYRTNCNALANVFNQAVPVWLVTSLVYLNRDKLRNYIFLGGLLLPFAPLPFLGVVIILVTYYVINSLQVKGYFSSSFKEIFSVQNVSTLLAVFPYVALYFFANSTTAGASGGGFSLLPWHMVDVKIAFVTVLFWLLTFGIIALLIYKDNRKNTFFYIVVVWLMTAIFIVFGRSGGKDFSMNSTMPAFFLLMVFTIQYVVKNVLPNKLSTKSAIILCYIFFMCLSPLFYVLNGFDQIGDTKTYPIVRDEIYTYADKDPNDSSMFYYNFLCEEPENTVFYKYITREK